MSAVTAWREGLAAWGIPQEILDAAPESPWGFPPELFRRRARSAIGRGLSPSNRRALEALPTGGTVMDVGCGGGAASLPLAAADGGPSLIVGVDPSEAMLEEFRAGAAEAGVAVQCVQGSWPEAGPDAGEADVVVCHHVVYNVSEIGPFARALDAAARRRVVVEITGRHPLSSVNDLWLRFHGLRRPEGPTAHDAAAALAELGLRPHHEVHDLPPVTAGFERREDAVAFVRRRLCLPAERDPEVAEALGDRLARREGVWSAGPVTQPVSTIWWDRA